VVRREWEEVNVKDTWVNKIWEAMAVVITIRFTAEGRLLRDRVRLMDSTMAGTGTHSNNNREE